MDMNHPSLIFYFINTISNSCTSKSLIFRPLAPVQIFFVTVFMELFESTLKFRNSLTFSLRSITKICLGTVGDRPTYLCLAPEIGTE